MQFVHQALTWGFLLALLPLLIHLINLMRRRRVKWAAMEFLLQSYRKHRKWIWLKQFVLLLARMAAVALVVAMVAQWITRQQWFAIFGSRATHHYALLDDSYSMSDRFGGATAFDTAKRALGQIASQAMAQDTPQKFTLIRFSKAAAASGDGGTAADRIADLNAAIIDANFDVSLEEKRRGMEVTQLAAGPREALEVLNQLLEEASDENSIVYVLSDFRHRQWASPAELRQLLRDAAQSGAEIHFASCVTTAQPNLGIVDLKPADDTRAAGVPLFIKVAVKNFGSQPAGKVPLKVRTVFYDPQGVASSEPGKLAGKIDEPPSVLIDEIAPGETATERVQVYFPQAGPQVVEAVLPEDPVAVDNRRWCVIDLPEGEPVLVVDGSPAGRNAYFLTAAMAPGGRANTGIRPEVKSAAFLRDSTLEALEGYRAIYLLDVDRLDDRAIENLEAYVRGGGGLGVFVGDNVNISFYNTKLYRDGEGVFPLPLERDDLLAAETLENAPDLEVTDHPLFSVLLGERNPLIRLVNVERYLKSPDDWKPDPDSTVAVIARLRNGRPLAVERQFGEGRVIAFLTTLSPDWNNWAPNPSFVVVLLKLQSYLSAAGRRDDARLVAAPIDVQLDASKYGGDVVFVVPGDTPDRPVVVQRTAAKPEPDSQVLVASLGRSASDKLLRGDTDRSGIYEAWPATVDGPPAVQRFAVNVDPDEGDLTLADPQSLLRNLEPVKVRFRYADEFAYDAGQQAGLNRSLLLLCLLIGLLLGEQLLAYSATYHPAHGVAR